MSCANYLLLALFALFATDPVKVDRRTAFLLKTMMSDFLSPFWWFV
jgi:hypothetical protein